MLKRRIESLGSVVESQQYQIDALTKVSALGEVWKGVALDLRLSTTPSAECSDVIDRCCRVMAWISQSCLNTVHRASDRGATHGAEPPDFQLHWFARDVAKQLSAADTALARRAAENKRLVEQLNAVQRRHHATDDEAQKYRHISDQLGMRLEDLSSKSRFCPFYYGLFEGLYFLRVLGHCNFICCRRKRSPNLMRSDWSYWRGSSTMQRETARFGSRNARR